MPYPQDSHLKDEEVRRMVVSACFANIALAAGGEWQPVRLEEKIDGREYILQSGKYRRMAYGRVPRDSTAKELRQRLGPKCRIRQWRDWPFWKLLMMRPLTHQDIENALLSVSHGLKGLIWVDLPQRQHLHDTRYPRYEPTREDIDEIATYKTKHGLCALVALAREARDQGILGIYIKCAQSSLEIFPQVVTQDPHLYICWKRLAKRLTQVIWQPKVTFSIEPRLIEKSLKTLPQQIRSLANEARERGIPLPPEDVVTRHNRNR